ncbi:hypothetical protein ACQP1U_00400 [Actinomycetota bacterium]
MSRVDAVNQRYAASAALARTGVEILAIGDPAGARFNVAVRRLVVLVREESGAYLEDLVGAAKALRWRRITQPQPTAFSPDLQRLAIEVINHAHRLRGAIGDQSLLDELASSADALAQSNSEVGSALLRSIQEVGVDACVVVAASRPAARGIQSWLRDHRVRVLTAGELEKEQTEPEQAYVVGPPRFYRSSLVTAPVTESVSFLLPAWFGDRAVPRSPIAMYAQGGIRVRARVFVEGDTSEPAVDLPGDEVEDQYLPQPVWGNRRGGHREPTSDEVEARKLLLSGNLAMWLDDGDRIRSLDPDQPVGERVTYTDVSAVRPGTYLLLRQGETERSALYQAAIARIPSGGAVDRSQAVWKHQLAERIHEVGYGPVVRQLRAAGFKAADRARAWTDPNLIRPASDQDFERLLQWLGIPIQPAFGYATMLRRTLYVVSAEIGKQLEAAVSAAELSELDVTGHLSLDIKTEGFRGILATRVMAVSPFTEIVARHDARVPFEDRSGQWLA